MNAPVRPSALVPSTDLGSLFSPKDVALIRRTCAPDANDDEFSVFVKTCQALSLNPLRKHVYCFIYNKDDAKRRRMSIVIGIDGFREIADRTGNYRPDDQAPVFTILPWKVSRDNAIVQMRQDAEKIPILERKVYLQECMAAIDDLYPVDPTNPEGIEKVTVRVFKYAHGGWHGVTAESYWSEYAPIKTDAEGGFDWEDTGQVKADGKPKYRKVARGALIQKLDDSGQWAKMPRGQLEKCCEAKAHRKASWSGHLANVYADEEVDRARVIDLTPAEMAELGAQQARLARVEAKDCLLVSWTGGATEALENVPLGSFADRVFAFIEQHRDEPSMILSFQERNRAELKKFWAIHKSDALAIKIRIEEVSASTQQGVA